MDTFALNGGVVNGWGSLARIVLLPSASVSITFQVGERASVNMVGSVDMSVDADGDLSKVVNIGEGAFAVNFATSGALTQNSVAALGLAEFSFAIDPAGDLTKNVVTSIGASSFGFGLDAAGILNRLVIGPFGTSDIVFSQTGDMVRIGTLVGDTTIGFDAESTLRAIRQIGDQSTGFALETSALLTRTMLLSGATSIAFTTPLASLSVGVRNYMTGQTGFAFSNTGTMRLTGGLSGNANYAINSTGNLNVGFLRPLPAASATIAINATGRLQLSGGLSGTVTTAMNVAGNLRIVYVIQIPAGASLMQMAVSGALRSTQRLSGSVEISMEPRGTLYSRVLIGETNSPITFDIAGALANNAISADLESLLMIRPESQREMTR